jgi:PPOX class probable F420-dependent enzyme
MDITLNDVAREVLDGPHIAAIATSNTDGRPQSSVIFVRRDGDSVVFSTIEGRLKTRNMARDPRVSLLVIDKENGRYVEIRGTVEITEDPEKRLLYEMYNLHMGGTAAPPEPDAERLIVRITPQKGLPVPAGRGMSDFIRDTEPFRRELLPDARLGITTATIIGGTERRPTSVNKSANNSSGNRSMHSRCSTP